LFKTFFDPSQMGLSVSRICMGSSDYSTKEYSYSEGGDPDPEMKRFSIEHDRAYILPMLREARAVNPDMWILGSPWSPPAWMKPNKSMLGGSMRRSSLAPYAFYFEKFLDAYAAEGVRVNSVTPQNEIDTEQDGRMPAACWPQEYEIEFVRDHLGPRMAKSANPADIWILDHNYNLWGRVVDELEDPVARPFIKGVAWHGYMGKPDQMMNVKKVFPDIDMFWTEGGPDWEGTTYATEWAKWADTFTGILRNQARCIIAWNYALDEKGNPNIGPFKCAGLVTIDSKTREISHSGQLWAFQHFSGHIRRGARVVDSSGNKEVQHVVAKNPGGDYVAVLTNTGAQPKPVVLAVGRASVKADLAADSVTTLAWK
jgi:glucosylceramidase